MSEIGHNLPPSDFNIELDRLREAFRSLESRRDDLVAAGLRIDVEIADEDRARIVTDSGRQLRDTVNEWSRYRESQKRPHLERGRAVDDYFRAMTLPLEDVLSRLRSRLSSWNLAKERAERQRREEAERKAQEEADRLAAAAMSDAAIAKAALLAGAKAEEASQAAAEPVKVEQTRGTYGGLASARKTWKCTSFDRAELDLEPLRPFLTQECLEKALRAFTKAGNRKLKGATIEHVTDTTFR